MYGLGGSGAGVVRVTGNQTVTGPLTLVSDGTVTPMLTIRGLTTDPVKQMMMVFDGFFNPLASILNVDGINAFGGRIAGFAPGDIFNPAFASMTNVADNLAANAAGIKLGRGAGLGVAIFTGSGAPSAVNPVTSGIPVNGCWYLRIDGGVATGIYQTRAGAWVAVI